MKKVNGRHGFVYIGIASDGLFKIGKANKPEKREREIQGMNPSYRMLYWVECGNSSQTERALHEAYEKKQVAGEWFSLTIADVADILEHFSGEKQDMKEIGDFIEAKLVECFMSVYTGEA